MTQYLKGDGRMGAEIKARRLRARLTQEEVAARLQVYGCDIVRSTYSKIEDGRRHLSLKELDALCKIFQVDYNQLLGYREKE